jgi:tyrosyl-tRNA synthetase
MNKLIDELKWRGLLYDYVEGLDEILDKENVTFYLGIDPTAGSLHIGNLASIMLLKHLQVAGHKPVLLLGGATGMIGDPSGKSKERNLMTLEDIRNNGLKIKEQLNSFMNFDKGDNAGELVNNYDWMKDFSFIDFIRDIGKHITINYMMAKDSVKSRLEAGLSFTEFSYQMVQGYDFYHLFKTKNCKLQVGGADQWGNILTGTEFIRRKEGKTAYGLTCPLITRGDGGKFGKTEEGNVWLDPEMTSPYKFYQFWINVSDADAEKYIKVFTLLPRKKIEEIISEHNQSPHQRLLQSVLAKEVTTLVHSEEDYTTALEASKILFGKGTLESLEKLDEQVFLDIFEGVPQFELESRQLSQGIPVLELLTEHCRVFGSKGELKRLIKDNGLQINKQRIKDSFISLTTDMLINNKYMLIQKGKKNYFLIKIK